MNNINSSMHLQNVQTERGSTVQSLQRLLSTLFKFQSLLTIPSSYLGVFRVSSSDLGRCTSLCTDVNNYTFNYQQVHVQLSTTSFEIDTRKSICMGMRVVPFCLFNQLFMCDDFFLIGTAFLSWKSLRIERMIFYEIGFRFIYKIIKFRLSFRFYHSNEVRLLKAMVKTKRRRTSVTPFCARSPSAKIQNLVVLKWKHEFFKTIAQCKANYALFVFRTKEKRDSTGGERCSAHS